jgi:uncharacterized protein YrrD
MKFSELKGTQIISLADGRELGTVDDILIDLDHHQVRGLRVKTGGLFSGHEAVLLTDVKAIGPDAVTVEDASKLNAESKFSQLADCAGRDAIINSRIITEQGTVLGTVADVDVDFESGAITSYVLASGLLDRLRHQESFIPTSIVKAVGEHVIIVSKQPEQSEAGNSDALGAR